MKMRTSRIGVLLTLLVLSVTSQAQNLISVPRERVLTKTGVSESRSTELFPVAPTMGKIFEQSVTRANASFLRLRFTVLTAAQPGSWGLRVLDASRRLAWSYTSQGSESEFWSGPLEGDNVIVEVYSALENSPLRLKIDRLMAGVPAVKPQAITPPDNRAPIGNQTNQIKGWGRSVAKLTFISDADGGEYVCSGFLVSGDLFMTNQHCIQSATEAASAVVQFDYDTSTSKPVEQRFKELLVTDHDLDFALLRLTSNSGRTSLRLDGTSPKNNNALLIIQHPGGEPKQVSIVDCRVDGEQLSGLSTTPSDFGHLCDTLGGSSGSPAMILSSGRVVGLHHLGFAPTSQLLVNQAVRIGLIVDRIREKRPDLIPELGLQ